MKQGRNGVATYMLNPSKNEREKYKMGEPAFLMSGGGSTTSIPWMLVLQLIWVAVQLM